MARRATQVPPGPVTQLFEKYDPVFFPKEAIRKGTRLTNYGMRDPQSQWVVDRIETYTKLPSGLYRLSETAQIIHLSDLVFLNRVSGPEVNGFVATSRRPSFGSIRYSAIWRLA